VTLRSSQEPGGAVVTAVRGEDAEAPLRQEASVVVAFAGVQPLPDLLIERLSVKPRAGTVEVSVVVRNTSVWAVPCNFRVDFYANGGNAPQGKERGTLSWEVGTLLGKGRMTLRLRQ
jgi:phage baseplate assembly protein gpV